MRIAKTAVLVLVIVTEAMVTNGQFAQTNLFSGVNQAVPDGDVAGVQEVRTVVSEISQIKSVRVRLKVTGEFNGDLYGYVRHDDGTSSHIGVLINRTGRAATNHYGYADSGFDVTFDDSAAYDIHAYRNITNPPPGVPVSGTWQPDARFVDPAFVTTDFPRSAFLSAFNGLSASGEWTLFLADVDEGATNYINSWGLEFTGKATPLILWTNPAAITYGTMLSAEQLNAFANTAGTFIYNPPAGTVLNASNNHPLAVTFTPDDTNSYVTTSATVTIEILPRALTITADSTNKIYGRTLTFAGTEYAAVGLVNGDTIGSVTLTSVGTATNATAGNFDIIPNAATGVGLENYSIQYAAGNLIVEPAPLLVQANDASRAYGQTNPLFTATFTGLANGEDASALSGDLVFNTVADTNSPTGTYTIEPRGLFATNYAFTYSNGTLTVTAFPLTLNVDSVSRPYGSTNPPLSCSLTGLQNGEQIATTVAVTADTNSPVGVYPITPALDDPDDRLVNYTVSTNGGNLTIEPAPLLVRADDASRFYGETNPLFTATFAGFMNGEDTNVLAGELMVASSADTGSHVGGYPIEPAGVSATNYALIFSNGTLTVMPATLTLTMDSAFRAYGQTNPPLSGILDGIQNFDPVTVTFTTDAETNSPVGSYLITPLFQDPADKLGNYSLITNGGSLTIGPAPLLVQADDAGRAYGQTNPVFTATFIGFVNGEEVATLAGELICATSAETNSPVGFYGIEPSGLSATNYTLTYSNGTLTVSAFALNLNVDSAARAYGQTNPPLTGALIGVQNFDNITATFNTEADTNSPVGIYPITPSLDDPDGRLANYFVTTNSGSLLIEPALLLVSADDTSRAYGQTNPLFTAMLAGLVNGENISNLVGELVFNTTADTNSAVGTYPIEPSGLSATNYALIFSNGTLTVTASALIIHIDPALRLYGAANPPLSGSLTGGLNSDSLTVTFHTEADTNSPVGVYPITPDWQDPANKLVNYTVITNGGGLTIEPAPLFVHADDASRVYGLTNPAFSATFTGFVNGEDASVLVGELVLNTAADTNSPIGSYAIEPGGLSATNYSLTFSNGALTVTAFALTLTVDNQTRTYGDTNPPLSGTLTGMQNGDNLAAAFTVDAQTNSPVGNYPITPALDDPDDKLVNYVIITNGGNLTIDPAPLLVRADDVSRSYGQTNPMFSATFTGFVNGEDTNVLAGELTYSTAADTNSPVGVYAIEPGGLSATNYALTFSNGSLTVTAFELTLDVMSVSRVYGAPNPPLTGTLSGIQNGDDITTTFQTAADTNSSVGVYPITPTFLDPGGRLANYTLLTSNGSLTITKASITFTVSSPTNPVLLGAVCRFTVTLTAAAPASGLPTGTVQFQIDDNNFGAPASLASGVASLTTTDLSAGQHVIYIIYSGDDNFMGTGTAFAALQAVNTPPLAGPDIIYRAPAQGTRTPVSSLLANDSDADEDAVLFDSVNPSSTVGGTLGETNGWVNYTPPAGFTNDDSFAYVICDGRGGSATGVVTIAVLVNRSTAAELIILNLGHDTYRIISAGIPWGSYTIEMSEDLPDETWGTLAVGSADTLGIFAIDDTPEPGTSARFYRSVYEGDGAISAPFSLALTSSTNPAPPGSSVTFTLNLSPLAWSSNTASGTVQFMVDDAAYGEPVTMSNGTASLVTDALSRGKHRIGAEYAGNENFRSATCVLGQPQVINTPPVAGGDVVQRNPFQGTKFRLSDLLANDTDADGDGLTTDRIHPTTTEGGTLSLAEGWLFYTPPAGFAGADSFRYTVRDSLGGSDTTTVEITSSVGNAPSANLTLVDLGSGTYRIVFSGIPWRTYTIQYTESLAQPNWQSITTRTADSQGRFSYDDTLPQGTQSRYYRSLSESAETHASPFRMATWLNFIAQTNGRTMEMWSQRTYPPGWPNVPPVFAWNTNCLLYGWEGFTGISQCNEFEGAPGQVAVTLLSRRHCYARGHSMGENGIRANFFPGKRVWFCAADNTVVQMTVAAAFVRLGYMSGHAYDYSVLIFTEDVPDSITPISVMSPQDMEIYYSNTPDLPFLFLGTEQAGHCAANIPPFLYPIWKGGDSGAPDLIPTPDNKLVMYLGRGTSGITPQTQTDMDTLSLFMGLDPANYQLKWYDLSPWGP